MGLKITPSGEFVVVGSSQPEPLQRRTAPYIVVPQATPAKRKRGKSLSRRTGQNGHIEKSGKWFVVRFWKDIPGQEERMHVRECVCPIEDLQLRLDEAQRVGYGFALPAANIASVVPIVPKPRTKTATRKAA